MASPAASKRKGADYEIALLEYLREQGYSAERLRLSGRKDEGDIGIRRGDTRRGDIHHLIEAKAEKEFRLSSYVTELQTERINYARARRLDFDEIHGLVVVKRPRAKIWESYVVKTLADELLLWEYL